MMDDKAVGCFRYDDVLLDEESLRKVREELNEDDEIRRKCLEELRKKLIEKDDLNPCLSKEFLLANLRVSKFDCTKAYERILRYYDERWNLPEIFQDYSPSSVKPVECARQVYACPYRNKDHSAVFLVKRGYYDASKMNYDLIIRSLMMIGETAITQPLNQMCGLTIIMDMTSPAWGAWTEYTPSRLKLIARLLQKSLAVRIRKIHVINAPPIYFILYSIIYPFLSAKMRNRIIIHKNCKSLHSYIDPGNLTKEYGGSLEQSDLINLFERIYKMEDFFQALTKYGYINKK